MKPIKILLLVAAVWSGLNFARAQTWTQTSAPSNTWTSVASSADGNKLVAATHDAIYISTNSGTTWTQASAPANNWFSVASSADGNNLVAATFNNNSIYVSTDSGDTWTQTTAPNAYWSSVASSADGIKLVAVIPNIPFNVSSSGEIYTSTNGGTTWIQQTNAPKHSWCSVASSADGSKLVAYGGDFSGPVYTSTDSGITWTHASTPFSGVDIASPSKAIASSADGTKLAVAPIGMEISNNDVPPPIYISTNSGGSWMQTSAPSNYWISISSSADGNKLIAAASAGGIYISADSGATWTSNNVPSQQWGSVASSADGGRLVATGGESGGSGSIYTSQTTPTPQLNITPTNGSFKLSWLIPSTNFMMQQSSDLSSWSDVTDAPVLNLDNLQNEVILPPTNSSGFYRLKTQ